MEKIIDIAKQCRVRMKQTAMGTDDFPYLLGTSMHKLVVDNFRAVPSQWRNWAAPTSVSDFKAWNRTILSEAERLILKGEHDPVQESYLTEKNYTVLASTYERAFAITRKMVINDDTNTINKLPARYGRSAGREIPLIALTALTAGGSLLAYDGVAFFHANHSNTASNALAYTETGAGYIVTAVNAIKSQKDIASRTLLGLVPKYLVTGTTLASKARRLCQQELVPNSGGVLVANEAYGLLTPIEEPFLDQYSATAWYVLCDPNDVPAIEIPFYQGLQEPQTLMLGASVINQNSGAPEPYDFVYEEIKYKVRLEFGAALAEYKAIYRGNS